MNCLDSSQVVTFFYLLYYLQKFSRTDAKKDFLKMYYMVQFHNAAIPLRQNQCIGLC